MDVKEGIQNLMKKPRPYSRFLGIFRRRELDGSPTGVYSMSTIVGAEFVKWIDVKSNKDKNYCSITGVAVLPYNKLVAIDKANSSVKVIDTDRCIITTEKTLSSTPYDITVIDFNEVAVSLPRANRVIFVKINNGIQIVQNFELEYKYSFCNSLTYCCGKLFVGPYASGKVGVLDMECQFERSVDRSETFRSKHVTSAPDNDKVCIANGKDVFVVKFDGSIVAEYKFKEFSPKTATIDKNGNVYFIDRKQKSLYQIRADCKTSKELLRQESKESGTDNGLLWADCATYSDAENRFYVGRHYSAKISVYRGVLGLKT